MKLTNPLHSLKQLTLDPERKARMRAELSSYADLHTVPETIAAPTVSPLTSLLGRTRRFYAGALAALLIVLGGTQASLAAEGALPGDILYPIKVAVNEPLALSLSFAPERKAELAAEFAARRLDEAARLSASGRLGDRQATELATRFDAHVETLARETDALESKGALAASLAVRTDLGSRIAEGAEDFAKKEVGREDVAATATLMTEDAAAGQFANRVLEKSKTLATTREKLESALALDLEASGDVRTLARGEKKQKQKEAFTADLAATGEATTTATTTQEDDRESEERESPLPEFPVQRFFAPFGR